jgi:hypothetical protein
MTDQATTPPEPPVSSPGGNEVVLSYVAVAAAVIVAALIYTITDPELILVDVEAFSIFAPLYIAAQAVERLLEPLASRRDTTAALKATLKQRRAETARLRSLPTATAEEFARAQRSENAAELALAQAKSTRAVKLWAAATVISLLVCAALGLGLIEAVAKERPTSEFIRTLDVLLTGIAVGAGTKPLHDLITRIEKAKDNADSATNPTPA